MDTMTFIHSCNDMYIVCARIVYYNIRYCLLIPTRLRLKYKWYKYQRIGTTVLQYNIMWTQTRTHFNLTAITGINIILQSKSHTVVAPAMSRIKRNRRYLCKCYIILLYSYCDDARHFEEQPKTIKSLY